MDAPRSKSEMDCEVYVFDRRTTDAPEIKISISSTTTFKEFKEKLKKALNTTTDDFVISTTSREELKGEEEWGCVENGDTFYVLNDITQELCAPAQERVDYLPHYDTIVKGGMYEYYASEGQNPLPYAFAELIDNALAATALNEGQRKIELRLYVDDAAVGKNCIVVLDNGKGMTPRQLNNWAIYRLSKFTRRKQRSWDGRGGGESAGTTSPKKNADESVNLADALVPRFMNSDISYFGVGGKQAVFFIGNATRMISKPKDSKDVHELSISKEEFERKERTHQSIYAGYIRNRKPGDASHLNADDEHVARLISEEVDRESFTAVVIQGINPQHLTFLKHHFHMWTRQLAHIYHFYLHGPDGNVLSKVSEKGDSLGAFNNIDIQVNMNIRAGSRKAVNLRTIEDDMQTQYARTAASTFDFKAYVDGYATAVEGIIRYHPFKYDHETYPIDVYGVRVDPAPEDDHGYAINNQPARGRRPVFETFWNGRFIPYTLIEEFDWCSLPKRQKNIPDECYNRISGVIWTNDSFQVSTNKLTFLDLEMKLRDKNTNFVRIVQGHEKRTNIDKEFQSWLRECNEEYDKQILFSGNKGVVTRLDQPKHKQMPWTKFTVVDWDSKTFKAGQMVRILRTSPVLCGTIQAFYLYGDHEGDVYATGGDIELLQEPQSLYTERKFVSLNKLDRSASNNQILRYIEEEEAKLPDHLIISWPNGLEVKPNESRLTGKVIGDLKVEICNRKGEKISKIPFAAAGSKKLMMELKIIWHSPTGDEVLLSLLSQHGKTWPYWFKKMDCTRNLGSYTLQLNAVFNESGNTTFAGHQLPSHKIEFTVSEAEAVKFSVGILDGPFKIGVPFNIPLEFQDRYNNATRSPAKIEPVLDADGLELSHENTQSKGHSCFIKGVVAVGLVNSSAGKNFNLKVSIPGFEQTHSLKIRLLPGPAAKLNVLPEEEQRLENGSSPSYTVEVQDAAGNPTCGGKLNVLARLTGGSGLPSFSVDCSTTGTAVMSGKQILLKNMSGEKKIVALFDIQGVRNMKAVERTIIVTPSSRAAALKVFYTDGSSKKEVKAGDVITREAGSILDSITYEILNEAGDPVDLDEKLVNKVKVNWAPKVGKDLALEKQLPPIKVLHSISEPRYCQASVMEGDGIELQFSVMAKAGPASQMICELTARSVALGQPLVAGIQVKFKDKYGNEAKLPPRVAKVVKASGPAVKPGAVTTILNDTTAEIKNVTFSAYGHQEVQVTWEGVVSVVKCEVLAGPPALLKLDDGWDSTQPLSFYSNRPFSKPLRARLVDEEGNFCMLKNVKVAIIKDQKLKMQPATGHVMTYDNGCADFGYVTLSGPVGTYELQLKVMGRNNVEGPTIPVQIQPDPDKPASIEVTNYQSPLPVMAGRSTLDFTINIKSETGAPLASASSDCLSMQFSSVQPDSVVKNGPGSYIFKECQVPDNAGSYPVQFIYNDGRFKVFSSPITIQVEPGHPALFVVKGQLTTPTVSNTRSISSRTLIRSLELELMDEFGNCVSKDYDGKVQVEITTEIKVEELPLFNDGLRMAEFELSKGQCKLQNLQVQENSPGKDGFEYTLKCTVLCGAIPKNKPLAPLNIPFLFYNDAKKQQQMAALSKDRDDLRRTVQAYKSMFDMQNQLISELRASAQEAQKEEQAVRSELQKQNIPGNHLVSVETVGKLIQARTKDREQVLRTPRRNCGLPPADADPTILGKIGHLALVQQDDIARVLSWHMAADMDCVITHSTAKAKEVYQRTEGRQQVLPLDSIFRKNLPDWTKPLPLERYRPGHKSAGNPIYARNLLEFPKDEASCRVVFGMLLGDTLILDTLDHANMYRQELVKYTHCPTILTRSGDRIRSNGKFGGAMNKAPPMDKLRGCVFGQPLPIAYHAVCTQIETLERLKSCLSFSATAQTDLEEQLELLKLPEMAAKLDELKDAERKLREVEGKLGVSISVLSPPGKKKGSSGGGRTRQAANSASDVSSEPPLKQPKIEPGITPTSSSTPGTRTGTSSGRSTGRSKVMTTAQVMGSPVNITSNVTSSSTTPARTSRRIASMTTVVSDDGRKRLKKSV